MTDLYYAVTGRIPGDDEDTCLAFGPCKNRDQAIQVFKVRMIFDDKGLTSEDCRALEAEHGTAVFVNAILCSASPITVG